jgi:predicted dehydrogenase
MQRRTLLTAAPVFATARALGFQGHVPPSRRINMAVIGTGNQGTAVMRGFLRDERVQVVAVCDVNRISPGYWDGAVAGRDPARAYVDWHYGREARSGRYQGCAAYTDYRDVLRRKDIDALLIALPDHWHALPVIQAAASGKDIYGEKPLSLTIADGRAMVDAVKKHQRVFQCGSQQRSDPRFRQACELVRNGRLGKIHTVRIGLPGGTPDYGRTGDRQDPEPVPEGFDYDMWLGPAPDAPYSPARCHVNFRWNLDYSGGQITDWGGHHPDIAQWALDTDTSGPVAIRNGQAVWAKEKVWNTAVDYYFEAIYASGVKMIVSSRNRGGITFEGSEGSVWVTRGAIEATPASLLVGEPGPVQLERSGNHYRNFIDCVYSRREPIAAIEKAHRAITISHIGNISLRQGRDLRWDPQTEKFIDDEKANSMLQRPVRRKYDL